MEASTSATTDNLKTAAEDLIYELDIIKWIWDRCTSTVGPDDLNYVHATGSMLMGNIAARAADLRAACEGGKRAL